MIEVALLQSNFTLRGLSLPCLLYTCKNHDIVKQLLSDTTWPIFTKFHVAPTVDCSNIHIHMVKIIKKKQQDLLKIMILSLIAMTG